MQDAEQYDAIFHGKVLDGVDPKQARENFTKLFKLDKAAGDALFSRLPMAIKKGLSKDQAKQLKIKVARAGFHLSFRKIQPAAQTGLGNLSLEPMEQKATKIPAQSGQESTPVTPTSDSAALSVAEDGRESQGGSQSAPEDGQVWGKAQPRVKAQSGSEAKQRSASGSIDASAQEGSKTKSEGQSRFVDFEFTGNGAEYFRIWIVNILLSIVTLGIYSAWAKVRNNQYFYGHTQIEGSSFEYLANPIVILKGRLIAFAAFIVFAAVQHFFPLIGVFLPLLLLPLVPWVVVRSLAFNARNSAWRNVRFNFQAHWFEALKAFILWPMAGSFTLGLLMPYALNKQKHFLVNHSSYGTSKFEFECAASIWYRFFLRLVGAIILFSLIAGILSSLLTGLGLIAFALLYLGIYAAYKVFEGNLVMNLSHLGQLRFHSELELKPYAWIFATNTLAIFLTFGIYIPWAKVRMAQYRADSLQLEVVGSLDEFVADEQERVTALGAEMGEMFDMEFSVI
ncbi:DUF898 domain-containing protein [Aestuariirhabdus sp. Z084]|uniref:YjgN family protein n=1 Tax=Aestuariirhabdus haliotis TaxID=2918751 RepID=UPI00201B3ABB|nr:YjgN family protein [Aestuariirhabdus haliotis]MCL6416523.1 DUF898 domain-containing protein [Aestuariirhabdus haliotis]MCL6420513.1 DUF898 domain-containing protein [Aestuariirhabdus haliotis]